MWRRGLEGHESVGCHPHLAFLPFASSFPRCPLPIRSQISSNNWLFCDQFPFAQKYPHKCTYKRNLLPLAKHVGRDQTASHQSKRLFWSICLPEYSWFASHDCNSKIILFDFYIHSAKSNLHSTTDDDSPEKIQPLKNVSDYVKKWQREIQNHQTCSCWPLSAWSRTKTLFSQFLLTINYWFVSKESHFTAAGRHEKQLQLATNSWPFY